MKNNWLKERLPDFKQNSAYWQAFAGALEDMWNECVEPILTRISDRKSFFTMSSEDMDTRIAEYGRFFIISDDRERRPLLLTQRLDEVHFKGTTRPIEQTLWREFGEMPVTWEPLYAPVNIDIHPYGSYLATAEEVITAADTYGDFFLTSRGRVVLNLNKLYEEYGTEDVSASIQQFQADFEKIILPLIPLHIVYEGLTMNLEFRATERKERLIYVETVMSFDNDFYLSDQADRVGDTVIDVGFDEDRVIRSLPRSLEPIPICIDTMPLDAWPIGITAIIPPIIPARSEGDTRLFEQDMSGENYTVGGVVIYTYEQGESRLMLNTLGQYGCLVEYTDGRVLRYGFPGFVESVVLQVLAGDWKNTIRKIIYLLVADETLQRAGFADDRSFMSEVGINARRENARFVMPGSYITKQTSSQSDTASAYDVRDAGTLNAVVAGTESVLVEPSGELMHSTMVDAVARSQVSDRADKLNKHSESSVITELVVDPLPRDLDTIPVILDVMPIDGWPVGQTEIIPAIIPAETAVDARIFEQVVPETGETGLYIETLGANGCLIEYQDEALATILFPDNSTQALIQDVADGWRKTIRKITYIIGIAG